MTQKSWNRYPRWTAEFAMATGIPKTSSTAHADAQSATLTMGFGLVRRLARRASITCPWLIQATSRTGQARSMILAMPRR